MRSATMAVAKRLQKVMFIAENQNFSSMIEKKRENYSLSQVGPLFNLQAASVGRDHFQVTNIQLLNFETFSKFL